MTKATIVRRRDVCPRTTHRMSAMGPTGVDELSAATELLGFKHFLRGPSSNDGGSTTTDNAPS